MKMSKLRLEELHSLFLNMYTEIHFESYIQYYE